MRTSRDFCMARDASHISESHLWFSFAQIINNLTALHFLQALGYQYTKEELLESELDVLKSLDFQINRSTPLEYVETLMEVLGTLLCWDAAWRFHREH